MGATALDVDRESERGEREGKKRERESSLGLSIGSCVGGMPAERAHLVGSTGACVF